MKKLILTILIIPFLLSTGCEEEEKTDPVSPPSTEKSVASCEGCHTNYSHLKEVYTPDPPDPGGGGCGGETPHIEPYDRAYLGGDGYEHFKTTVHGKMPCTTCHNGVDSTDSKSVAHSGDFLKKPSLHAEEKCASCHSETVGRTKNSLHANGWGQKNMLSLRSGMGNIPDGFEQLTELMKEGYDINCAKCHATCGDCHVNRPKAGGGGLYRGHDFTKKPDMRDICITCHVSRGGHAYMGVAPGTVPDVHLINASFTCMNCHYQNEVHGDYNLHDQRYKVTTKPLCKNCHGGVDNSNAYHTAHMNTFSCNTCHSQDYNNCGSCHIGGEGARIHSYQGYKIGMNPIPETKPYKYALLRQSLSAPDSWSNYGVEQLADFDAAPTYKYTTPHNIIKITTRTGYKDSTGTWQLYNNCYEGCHISKNPDGSFNNKELYLFDADCEEWEKSANVNIIVDGKLPVNWEFE